MALYNADLNVSGTLTVPSGIYSDSVTVSGASVLTSESVVGGGGSALTVQDQSGATSASDVSTIKVTDGTLTDDGGGIVSIETGGATIGGIPTTASGSYWSSDAPPEYPTPFDDEFDTFTDNPTGTGKNDNISDVWTQFNPGGNLSFDHLFAGDGVSEMGLGMGHLGNATPTWNGFARPIAPMVATASGGQNYWFETKISMGEREGITGLGGIFIGGDVINNPTTEEILYIALENNHLTVKSESVIRHVSNGVLYNSSIGTSASVTSKSGPQTSAIYLRIQYDGLSNGYAAMYSTDGLAWSYPQDTLIGSGTLNFTPTTVGLIGRAEDTFGSWQTNFPFFRFRLDDDRNAGTGRISSAGLPLNGRRIYTNPVAAIPSDLIAVSGTFSESLTVSGVPVNIGAGGGSGTITDINTVATGPSVTITGTGGINTITDGNVITISGAGSFSPGFQGARLSTTSGIATVNNVSVNHPWDTVVYDTNGFANSGDVNTFIIPAGIKKIVLKTSITWSTNATGFRRIQFRRDGLLLHATTSFPVPSTSTATTITSPIIDVVEGEQFNVLIGQGSGGALTTNPGLPDTRYFFELEVIDPRPVPGLVGKKALNGALIRKNADQTFTSGVETQFTWQTIIFDSNSWADLANDRFIVPEGVTKVQVSSNAVWSPNATGARGTQVQINGASRPGIIFSGHAPAPTANTAITQVSGPVTVTPGDLITIVGNQTSGGDLDVKNANSTWFAVEAIETNENFQIDEFTAASGTFTQSLTISGVPVSTGTGGGVSDHAALTNLDFASAAHTGFASEAELLTVSGGLQDQIDSSPVGSSNLRNAFFTSTSGSSLGNDVEIILPWDTVNQDIGGWVDPSDDSAFLVPSGVTNVRLWGQIRYQNNSSGHRRLLIRKNSEGATTDPLEGTVAFQILPAAPDQVTQLSTSTATIPVVAGDTFRMHARQTSGITLTVDASTTTFFIEEVKNVISTDDAITAASGTFTQSLTISGVPVNIGSGAGVTKYQQMFTDQTSVSVTHNMGSIIHITTILDSSDFVVDATIQYGTNTDTVTFSEAQSGSAIVLG